MNTIIGACVAKARLPELLRQVDAGKALHAGVLVDIGGRCLHAFPVPRENPHCRHRLVPDWGKPS